MEIVRGDNRDKSGTNGDFLCIKGRYAFDFANHEERLTQPLIRKEWQADSLNVGRGVRAGRKEVRRGSRQGWWHSDRRDRLDAHHE